MAIKLHRCSNMWVKVGRASVLARAEGAGRLRYRVRGREGAVPEEQPRPARAVQRQRQYPVIEFEDGSVYREHSKDMAATIAAGALDTKRGPGSGTMS